MAEMRFRSERPRKDIHRAPRALTLSQLRLIDIRARGCKRGGQAGGGGGSTRRWWSWGEAEPHPIT